VLKISFKFHGKCSSHTRYNPEKNGHPSESSKNLNCEICDALWVIYLYVVKIGARKAKEIFPDSVKLTGSEENEPDKLIEGKV
jgi:hypothetical protein